MTSAISKRHLISFVGAGEHPSAARSRPPLQHRAGRVRRGLRRHYHPDQLTTRRGRRCRRAERCGSRSASTRAATSAAVTVGDVQGRAGAPPRIAAIPPRIALAEPQCTSRSPRPTATSPSSCSSWATSSAATERRGEIAVDQRRARVALLVGTSSRRGPHRDQLTARRASRARPPLRSGRAPG